jgi:hypothetical protein
MTHLMGTDAVVLDVPFADDDDAVFDWAHGITSAPTGVMAAPDLGMLVRELVWLDLVASRAFWEERGQGSLTRAVTSAFSGLSRLVSTVVVVVSSGPDGLHYRVGIDRRTALGARQVLASSLGGAVLEECGPGTCGPPTLPTVWPAVLALTGTPHGVDAPGDEVLIERLAGLELEGWTMTLVLEPVDAATLRERFSMLASLALRLTCESSAQVAVSDTHQAQLRNPVLERLAELVAQEQERCELGLRQGAYVALAWISARDQPSLASVAGVVAGTDDGSDGRPNPLRLWPVPAGRPLPGSVLLPRDVASLVQPPVHDVRGLPSRAWARFDEHVEPVKQIGHCLTLGTTEGGARLALPIDALTSHMLVAGMTGSGKTSFVLDLLGQATAGGVPVTVIEPTKGEYGHTGLPGLRRWSVGSPTDALGWRLNPLEVHRPVPVSTHIDLLVALFGATFGLVPPLPFLIEVGLRRTYRAYGWDLVSDTNPFERLDGPWPTLSDLLETCLELVDERYVGEVRHNVAGALTARLGSLLDGPKGRLLDTDEPFDTDAFLTDSTVVDLDMVGNDREKAFIIALVLIRIWESTRGVRSRKLRHLTVLEEAHRLLGAPASADHALVDSVPDGSFAADTFVNMLAEIRSAGEGIVIVDQSPSSLATSATVNTGVKVVLRLQGEADQRVVRSAMNLEDDQLRALASAGPHMGAVFWEGMDRPVMARLVARFPTPNSGPNPAERPNHRPSVVAQPDARLRAAAEALLRSEPEGRSSAMLAVRQHVTRHLPAQAGAAEVTAATRHVVTAAVERLGRARRWDRDTRARAVRTVLNGDGGPTHPSTMLIDGRLPLPACRTVCPAPTGGCLFGELTAPAARRIRSEGPAAIRQLLGDTELRRRRIRREVIGLLGEEASVGLTGHAERCLVARTFDPDLDPDTVGGIVAELAKSPVR